MADEPGIPGIHECPEPVDGRKGSRHHRPSVASHERATIVALSSPAGRSLRAIVRLSGPEALRIAGGILRAPGGERLEDLPGFRHVDGRILRERFPCRVYLMRAPRSYTREDVVELHLTGSPVIAEMAVEAALRAGARLAHPGEFTRRAVENGRLSPDQAEAVINVIRARSRAELAAAADQLVGTIGRELSGWRQDAEELAAEVEAELDYGEAPGGFLDEEQVCARLAGLSAGLEPLLGGAGRPSEEDRGAVRCALAGPANAGKSLLFRRLTGRDVLVSADRGTTRDVLEAPLSVAPNDLVLLDTAGLGAAPGDVELLARSAAERAWRGADLILLVLDRSTPFTREEVAPALDAATKAGIPVALVLNKSDMPPAPVEENLCALSDGTEPVLRAEVSAFTGEGCEALAAGLAALVYAGRVDRSGGRGTAAVRRREVIENARESLRRASEAISGGLGLDCAADDLREAVRAVALQFEPAAGTTDLDEAVLGRIFARFCVGK